MLERIILSAADGDVRKRCHRGGDGGDVMKGTRGGGGGCVIHGGDVPVDAADGEWMTNR